MRISATRSGNSFQNGPSGVCLPPSIATMPSKRLQSSLNWQNSAAVSSKAARGPASAMPASQKAAPATAAIAMLAIEIWFGVMAASLNRRAMERAQPVSRLASGRRLSSCTTVQAFLVRQSVKL
ncbi:hypothetical protein BOSEA31B_12874 [Hyphomicrobiales bacterium]|nr:hypothetical protein BOSEA31B_12874 [Hyphomicrobiales bacterium]CAH1698648.1 hypothetical protein BOSEA1005_11701 [Hyphomicrobiales bacterium]CAI0342293.1 hypothetical protein BO1005MUT1_180072 [Hyphomicrobiales bacterium]